MSIIFNVHRMYLSVGAIPNNNLLLRIYRSTYKSRKKFVQRYHYSGDSTMHKDFKKHDALPKAFVKFEDVIAQRRNEAERSIIVQVHSEKSCLELYNYCDKVIPVVAMFNFKVDENHFVLMEFSEKVEDRLLPKCADAILPEGANGVPVRSPFLWFKAASKRKKLIQNDNSEPPIKPSVPSTDWQTVMEWISSTQSVSDGMQVLYESTKLDEVGCRLRYLTAHQLELSLRGLFPYCAALPFGSSVNGFGRAGCDLDLVLHHVFLPAVPETSDLNNCSRLVFQCKANSAGSRIHTQRQMEILADLIQFYMPGCTGVKRILQARVPIVKYTNEISGLDCDVSMTNLTGFYMSEVLYLFASLQPNLVPLVFTVKKWASIVGLTNPTPGRWITNFTLTLLCIFYLQVSKHLPSLNTLRQAAGDNDKRFTEDIDCTFCRDLNKLSWTSGKNCSLENLLNGFLEYYTSFDFSSSGISLSSGGPFTKPDYSPMYVANPLEKGLNVSKNISGEELERFKVALREAVWNMEEKSSLMSILAIEERLAEHLRKRQRYIPNRMVAVKDLFVDR